MLHSCVKLWKERERVIERCKGQLRSINHILQGQRATQLQVSDHKNYSRNSNNRQRTIYFLSLFFPLFVFYANPTKNGVWRDSARILARSGKCQKWYKKWVNPPLSWLNHVIGKPGIIWEESSIKTFDAAHKTWWWLLRTDQAWDLLVLHLPKKGILQCVLYKKLLGDRDKKYFQCKNHQTISFLLHQATKPRSSAVKLVPDVTTSTWNVTARFPQCASYRFVLIRTLRFLAP